jgi:hypothetical protein
MLVKSSSKNNPKQISINGSSANAIVYEVPAGRFFSGYLNLASASNFGVTSPGSSAIISITAPAMVWCPLELLEGVIVRVNSSSIGVSIIGVEYDA